MKMNIQYLTAMEISQILGVGRTKAFEITRQMNEELEKAGYNTIRGKVPAVYFQEKYYGCRISE